MNVVYRLEYNRVLVLLINVFITKNKLLLFIYLQICPKQNSITTRS